MTKSKHIKLIFALAGFVLLTTAFANNLPPANLQNIADTFLKEFKDKDHLTGISITLSCRNSKPISVFSGKISRDPKSENITSLNLWQIGSITKSFASIVILQLEKEHKFDINKNRLGIKSTFGDILQKYSPKTFKSGKYSNWYNVTLEQLMNMTAGIPEYIDTDDKFRNDFAKNPNKFYSLDDILSYEKNKNLDFIPATSWNYSDTGYILLGYIIKIVTNNEPGFEIKKRVIDKIHLKHTYYVINDPQNPYKISDSYTGPNISQHLVHGYYWEDSDNHPKLFTSGTDVTTTSLSAAATAGSIISTTEDIDTFVRKLFTTDELLPKNQINKMKNFVSMKTGSPIKDFKNQDGWFGLGIAGLYDYKNKKTILIMYNGETFGYISGYRYFPKNGLIVTAMINTTKDSSHAHIKKEIFEKVINEYWDQCSPI